MASHCQKVCDQNYNIAIKTIQDQCQFNNSFDLKDTYHNKCNLHCHKHRHSGLSTGDRSVSDNIYRTDMTTLHASPSSFCPKYGGSRISKSESTPVLSTEFSFIMSIHSVDTHMEGPESMS